MLYSRFQIPRMYRSLPTCQILLIDVPSTPMYHENPPLDFHIVVVVLLALLAVCVAMIFMSLSLFCSCERVFYQIRRSRQP